MENNYKVILETDEGTQTLTTPEEKSEAVADLVKIAAHLYRHQRGKTYDIHTRLYSRAYRKGLTVCPE